MSLIAELKRRNVFRVGIAYVICAWVIAQVADRSNRPKTHVCAILLESG